MLTFSVGKCKCCKGVASALQATAGRTNGGSICIADDLSNRIAEHGRTNASFEDMIELDSRIAPSCCKRRVPLQLFCDEVSRSY